MSRGVSAGGMDGAETYHIVHVPHALRAGCLEVAGDDAPHARVDGRFEDRLLQEGRLRVDGAQEDVDLPQVLGERGGWVCGAVAEADLDAARAEVVHGGFGCGRRARQGGDVLCGVVSAEPMQGTTYSRIGQTRAGR